MFNHIKIELKRALGSREMLYTIIAVLAISIVQILVDVVPVLEYVKPITENTPKKEIAFPLTVFSKALCFNFSSSITYYFYLILPVFAAIPFASVLYKDSKSGYTKNVFIRTPKMNYYIAQYVAAFISAGIVAVIPCIFNTAIVALMLPSVTPYPGIGYVGIFDESMFVSVYYYNPYLYLLLFGIINFVIYGLLNTMALSFMMLFKSKFAVIMFPFLIDHFIFLAADFLDRTGQSITGITLPTQQFIGASIQTVTAYVVVMLSIDGIAICKYVKRKDCYD